MRRITVGLLVSLAVGLAVGLASGSSAWAQEQTYPQQAYVVNAPNGPDWLALLTRQGRWLIQIDPNSCDGLSDLTQVELTAPMDDEAATLVAGDQVCAMSARAYVSAVPCARRDDVCDVTHEPRD